MSNPITPSPLFDPHSLFSELLRQGLPLEVRLKAYLRDLGDRRARQSERRPADVGASTSVPALAAFGAGKSDCRTAFGRKVPEAVLQVDGTPKKGRKQFALRLRKWPVGSESPVELPADGRVFIIDPEEADRLQRVAGVLDVLDALTPARVAGNPDLALALSRVPQLECVIDAGGELVDEPVDLSEHSHEYPNDQRLLPDTIVVLVIDEGVADE